MSARAPRPLPASAGAHPRSATAIFACRVSGGPRRARARDRPRVRGLAGHDRARDEDRRRRRRWAQPRGRARDARAAAARASRTCPWPSSPARTSSRSAPTSSSVTPGLGQGGRAGAGSRRRDRRGPRLQSARAAALPDRRHAEGRGLHGGRRLRDRRDRRQGRPPVPAGAPRPPRPERRGRPGQAGELLDRGRPRRSWSPPLASLDARARSSSRRASSSRLTAPDLDGARAVAEQALSAPVTVIAGSAPSSSTPRSSRRCCSSRREGRRARSSAAPRPTVTSPSSSASSARPPAARTSPHPAPVAVVPRSRDRPRRSAFGGRRARRGRVDARTGRRTSSRRSPSAARRRGARDGDHRHRRRPTRRSTAAIANRIHNVQLVAHLVDSKLIAPGATFSFNQATGERTAAKGFLEAPVIINGEVETGLGGGVCQVSTTVFNAAYEAGLPITERTNHALYISHYPLGRDATVDYPDVDLKFVNDTPHWLLLRTFVGSASLVVTLYGAPQHRRVVSERRSRSVGAAAGPEDARPLARARERASSRPTARPPTRPRSHGSSTRPTGSCCRTRPGTRATARAPRSCASGRSRSPPKPKPAPQRADRDDDDDSDARPAQAARDLQSPRAATRGIRVGRSVAHRPSRGPSSRRRSRRRRARPRTRTGSARRAGRGSARARAGGRRRRRARGSARASRARATRSPGRAAADSRLRTRSRNPTRATSNQTR